VRKFLASVVLILCFAVKSHAQVAVALTPTPAQQFFTSTGIPLASGCVYTNVTNSSTPLATYTDGTGTVIAPNPIVLDIGGFASIWLKNASYRFIIYSKGLGGVQGSDCFSGVLQRTVDLVSAYASINQAQALFLLGQSSDPSGSAGELIYRTDIPCFRGFSTLWDCFVTLTGIQTLTNKTLTAPVLTAPVSTNGTFTNPTIGGTPNTNGPATYINVANSASGTVVNDLTKLVGAPSTAQFASTSDTNGIIGITVAGAAIGTGTATIQQSGAVNCNFDGATTAGDYVQTSSIAAALCHDSGAIYPTSGQVIGRVLSTNTAGPGPFLIDLFSPEIAAVQIVPKTVYNTPALAGTISIASTLMVTPSANLTYRFSVYMDQTALGTACAGSTTVTPALQFQDPNGAAPVSTAWATTFTIANNGALGTNTNSTATTSIWTTVFRAKSGVAIQYSTTFTAGGSCAPAPAVQVFPILEQITAN